MRSNFYYSEVLCGMLTLRAFRESPKSGENIAIHVLLHLYVLIFRCLQSLHDAQLWACREQTDLIKNSDSKTTHV